MELGQKLKNARLAAGLSQRQLCGDTVTRNMLSLIENGSAQPSMDTLRVLAARLQKPLSYFLDEADTPAPLSPLAEGWQALEQGQYALALDVLSRLDTPTEQAHLLRCLATLPLAEAAIADGRIPYAQELLASLEEPLSKAVRLMPLLRQQAVLLRFRAEPRQAAYLAAALPEEPLLLRAAAALEQEQPEQAAALLDCVQTPTQRWYALRADACFRLGQYALAAGYYLRDEPRFLRQLEQCYEKLGDYQKAYHYACKQRDA